MLSVDPALSQVFSHGIAQRLGNRYIWVREVLQTIGPTATAFLFSFSLVLAERIAELLDKYFARIQQIAHDPSDLVFYVN
jgi:hypothetical protein